MEGWGALFPRIWGSPCNLSSLAHLGSSLHRPRGSDSPAPEPWLSVPICPDSGGQSPVALSTQTLGAPRLPLTLVPSLLCTLCKLHVPVPWRAAFCKPPLALAMLPNLLQWGEPPALGRGAPSKFVLSWVVSLSPEVPCRALLHLLVTLSTQLNNWLH